MSTVAPPADLPAPVLRVGVTGHRDLSAYHVEKLRGQVSEILKHVRDAAQSAPLALKEHPQPAVRLVLVSPLAAGADLLVAQEATKLGYALHVPLPFTRTDTPEPARKDPGAAKECAEEYARLLEKADAVLELAAPRAQDDEALAPVYRMVGRVVLDQSDLLIAIWDGEHKSKGGGAEEIARQALAEGMPMVRIPPSTQGRPSLCTAGWGTATCDPLMESTERIVKRLLDPFKGGKRPEGIRARRRRATGLAAELEGYIEFLGEPTPATRDEWWASRCLQGAWRTLLALGGRARPKARATSASPSPQSERVDTLSIRYQGLYRGSFVVIYALGALAVTLALLALASEQFHWHPAWHVALGVLELVVLSGVVTVYVVAWRQDWYRKGRAYRVLAELLRHREAVGPLGLAPAPRPRAHAQGAADLTLSWMRAHARAVAAEQGLPEETLSPSRLESLCRNLKEGWLDAQLWYHHVLERRYHRLGRCLERLALALFVLAFVAVVLHFKWSWMAFFAAWFPALAAAVHGILGHADFERHADRSRGMVQRLKQLRAGWRRATRHPLTPMTVIEMAEEAGDVMLSELDEWQNVVRHRDLRLP